MIDTDAETKAALRKAATVIQSLERREAARLEPIAIVGAGCRLPGGVNDLASLGAMLRAATDAIGPVPRDRFDAEAFYDADPAAAGKIATREGGFLAGDVAAFDPAFFGLSPREAAWLDPQHRLLLECAWEALDDAGIPVDRLRGTQVGVYVGIGPSDYGRRIDRNPSDSLEAYTATGAIQCFSAGRLSFLLGVHGPSLAVDTACSSSLVALHLACQAIRAGECELALAGGVLVMLSPEPFLVLSRLRALAPDGRCKTFSDRADGYGRGEGCGVIALKRLSSAQRDGDRVLAVIRGSAVNHDGPSTGLTAPNGSAQREVIRQALASARLAPAEVDYVEAHGTGTPLGDPVEVEALAAIYGEGRARPLAVGSIKSNIGHLESASGIAGVLKVVAALRDGALPPSLHADRLNPAIDWDRVPVRVVRAVEPWTSGERTRRAAVSSFGMSGTNAHVVLEEAPAAASRAAASRPVELFAMSAKTPAALAAVVARLRAHVEADPDVAIGDLAFSLATTRVHHPHRFAVTASSRTSLLAALAGPVDAPGAKRGKLAFAFTGQGAQVVGMGRELHAAWPAFRDAWDRCAAAFDRELTRPLAEVAWGGDAGALDQTAFTQPALFAFEYALAALWRSWGVEPDVIIGHSIGELVGACVAGVFSLDDAARLVAARARLMQALPAGGAMVAVAATPAEVAEAIAGQRGVAIAAINAPEAVVISGDEPGVAAIADRFASRGVRATRLRVSHGFHSARMEPMLDAFARVAGSIAYRAPDRPIASNVTGELATAELASARYWVDQVRATVRFADDVRALVRAGASRFVEIGPRPALASMIAATADDALVIASSRADRPETESALAALGEWYAAGGAVAWQGVFPDGGRRVELPGYPWERERHWIDLAPRAEDAIGAAGRWPLSGREVVLPGDAWHHVVAVGRRRPMFVADHVVHGRVMIAGAFHACLVLAVAAEHWPDRALELAEVEFVRVAVFDDAGDVELHVVLEPDRDEARRFVVQGRDPSGRWTTHVRGRVRPTDARPGAVPAVAATPHVVEPDRIHTTLAAMQIEWGPHWRWTRAAAYGDGVSTATLVPTYAGACELAPLHPAMLDNAFAASLVETAIASGDGTPRLPFAIERLRWWRPLGTGGVRLVGRPQRGIDVADFVLVGDDGEVLAEIEGIACRAAPADKLLPTEPDAATPVGDTGFVEIAWRVEGAPPARGVARRWALVGDGRFAAAVRGELEVAGQRVVALDASPDHVVHLGSVDGEERVGAAGLEAALVAGYDSALALVQRVVADANPPRLWLVTRGAQPAGGPIAIEQALLVGLGRVIALEHAELRCTRIDLDPARPADEAQRLVAELVAEDGEDEVALRGGLRKVARLHRTSHEQAAERIELAGDRPCRVEIDEPGVLDRLVLRVSERRAPGPGEVEIAVEALGLNFVAVLFALGVMPRSAPGGHERTPGGDAAGTIVALGDGVTGLAVGQRVVTLGAGTFRSHLTVPATLVVPVPDRLSIAEAASLPVAYVTAWYGLDRVARLRRGERVLVHSATGGIGHAAIQWAKHVGAEIFATAGTPAKRAYLESLGVKYVSDSRSDRFVADIRAWTNGEGVDVVLNSLAGELIGASFDLLRSHGRFVELGKRDYYADRPLGLRPFLRNLSFTLVDLLAMMLERPAMVRELLVETLGHVASGVFTPPPITTFPLGRAPDAFRMMARGEHLGKVVLTLPDPAARVHLASQREVRIRRDASYLVTGGLGGLGLSVAGWLAERGAGHVVLVGRSGATTTAQHAAIDAMRARGCEVTVARGDVADRACVARIVDDIAASGHPLRGVIHAAGLVEDALVVHQTPAMARAVMAPKVLGALHLHELTRQLPLDLFVLYSSGAGLLGSPGQANYAAANTFLDALAHHRRAHGLVALSIDWGPFAEVGMAATRDDRAARLAAQGMRNLTPAEGLEILGELLAADRAQVGAIPLDPGRWVESYPAAVRSRMLASLVAVPTGDPARDDVRARVTAASPAERAALVRNLVRTQVARVLRIPEAKVDGDATFASLGMDSLTGLELRNRLAGELDISLPATLIFQHPTVAAATELVLDVMLRAALAFAPAGGSDDEEGTL